MSDEIRENEWIRPNQVSIKPRREPPADPDISNIVGKRVNVNDPRLIKLVVKWKNSKDPEQFDHFIKDPKKIRELREVFNPDLLKQ